MRAAHPGRTPPAYRGLAQLAAHYTADMTSCALGLGFAVCDGVLRTPPYATGDCYERWGYEELAALFEWVVTRATVSRPLVLGLRFQSLEQLFPDTLAQDALTHELLELLNSRSRYWAHGTGGYGEGIHGWLDRDETALLADGLAPAALDALLAHWSGDSVAAEWHARCISRFAGALGEAVTSDHGVLWGRDLPIFYEHGRG